MEGGSSKPSKMSLYTIHVNQSLLKNFLKLTYLAMKTCIPTLISVLLRLPQMKVLQVIVIINI